MPEPKSNRIRRSFAGRTLPSKPRDEDEQVFLSILDWRKGISARSLVGTLSYNETRINNLLNRLVKKGYVKRTGSIGYRNIKFWLTPKGVRANGYVTSKDGSGRLL